MSANDEHKLDMKEVVIRPHWTIEGLTSIIIVRRIQVSLKFLLTELHIVTVDRYWTINWIIQTVCRPKILHIFSTTTRTPLIKPFWLLFPTSDHAGYRGWGVPNIFLLKIVQSFMVNCCRFYWGWWGELTTQSLHVPTYHEAHLRFAIIDSDGSVKIYDNVPA